MPLLPWPQGVPAAVKPEFLGENVVTKPGSVVDALAALAQDHRLAVMRLLVKAGDEGLSAGRLAEALPLPKSSLSFHLAQLRRAGLVRQKRQSRSIIYAADYAAMGSLLRYLADQCWAGPSFAPDADGGPHPLGIRRTSLDDQR